MQYGVQSNGQEPNEKKKKIKPQTPLPKKPLFAGRAGKNVTETGPWHSNGLISLVCGPARVRNSKEFNDFEQHYEVRLTMPTSVVCTTC